MINTITAFMIDLLLLMIFWGDNSMTTPRSLLPLTPRGPTQSPSVLIDAYVGIYIFGAKFISAVKNHFVEVNKHQIMQWLASWSQSCTSDGNTGI